MNDVETLHRGLQRMAPRLMQVLLRRYVEVRSREQFSELYGLELDLADLLVFKAGRSFDAALQRLPEPGHLPLDEELRAAKAFAEAPSRSVLALTEHREAIQQALIKAEQEAEASPARARENWLRRIAIVTVLAVAGYFYWRDTYGPKEHKPPEPHVRPITR